LNLPADFATVTVPATFAPGRITSFPSTTTGAATDASTRSPTLLSLELTDWSTVTVIVVPGLITIGGSGSGAAACSAVFAGLAPFAALPVLLLFCVEPQPYETSKATPQIQRERESLVGNGIKSITSELWVSANKGLVLTKYQGHRVSGTVFSVYGA
jgi:hypothetical protein